MYVPHQGLRFPAQRSLPLHLSRGLGPVLRAPGVRYTSLQSRALSKFLSICPHPEYQVSDP